MTSSDLIDGPDTARAKSQGSGKRAALYRMVMPGHLCPFGLKSKALLQRKGYRVEDTLLTTREEVEAFKAAHGVETTPITYIEGEKIGGFDRLKQHFGYRVLGEDDTSYTPIIAIFGATALMALAVIVNLYDGFPVLTWLKWFFAISMVVLAVQKLQDVGSFVNGFLGYDLLARRYVPYGYAYPFLELYAGVGMMALIGTASPLIWLVAPVGIFIGTVGAISVIKAVYVEKRDLKCACVGGGSNVPLGVISLTENLIMVGMGVWMLALWAAGAG
ncbi:MauE/DoxX family redox-associated membrane protein [Oceaniglobus ichthyenteri]|uniref:MauE/DoxX family redox-associated membrane protein n=1 Tax=Oceaniglobus ichthyenteri TaxID=2136177 RepID=UPI001F0B840C|nr:MauE/DoxX family redox-associated membrane protein [Oceaniglobus ichthyenteri]